MNDPGQAPAIDLSAGMVGQAHNQTMQAQSQAQVTPQAQPQTGGIDLSAGMVQPQQSDQSNFTAGGVATGAGKEALDTAKGMATTVFPGQGNLVGELEAMPAVFRAYEQARQSGKGIMDAVSAANDEAKRQDDARNVIKQRAAEFATKPDEATGRLLTDAVMVLLGKKFGGPKAAGEEGAAEGAVAGKTADVAAENAARTITKELHPPLQEMNNTLDAVKHELGNIHDFATENKMPLNTHVDLARAADAAASEARGVYEEKLLNPVKDETVSTAGANYRGKAIGENQNNATLGDIDSRISTINKELRGAYSKSTEAKTGTALVGDAELVAERQALTKILHKTISEKLGVPEDAVAELRVKAGRMRTIADNAKMAANQLDLTDTAMRRGAGLPLSKEGIAQMALNKIRGGQPAIAGRALRRAIANGEEHLPRTGYPDINPPSPAPFPRKPMVPHAEPTEVPSISEREPKFTSQGQKPARSQPAPFPRKPIPSSEGTHVESILERESPASPKGEKPPLHKPAPFPRKPPAWKTNPSEGTPVPSILNREE